jgi:hypothetical protein
MLLKIWFGLVMIMSLIAAGFTSLFMIGGRMPMGMGFGILAFLTFAGYVASMILDLQESNHVF